MMKINLLFCLLFICTAVNAQKLKLKTGQKFSYEGISSSDEKNENYGSGSYEYWQTNFEVIGHKNDTYEIKAVPVMMLFGQFSKIFDSTVPIEEQPKDFMAIAKKVISTSSYTFTINGNGNITSVNGVSEIKAAVLAKLKTLNIPEGHQKHQELADMIITDDYFNMHSSFFGGLQQNIDTAYQVKNNDQTSTGYKSKQYINRPISNSLIVSSIVESTEDNTSATGIKTGWTHTLKKTQLVAFKKNLPALPLLAEAKKELKYNDYYTPINKAIRTIQELADLFNKVKGSQTIEAEIMRKLDSLDKGFAKDNYPYLGAKLGVLTYVGDGYYEILKKVPYEFLPDNNDIENKLTMELEKGNFSNVKKAVELCFTKFKGDDFYPMNMENTSRTLHDKFGGLIYRLKDQDSLRNCLSVINQVEQLQIPIVTAMFRGLKTYTRAKLAIDQNELTEIAKIHFNTTFDKAGRYRILIYDELVKKHVPDSVKLAYIDYTIDLNKKKIAQIDSGSIENIPPFIFKFFIFQNKIAYKKNLADAYYRKSKLQKSKEVSYLQMAADYLPTQQDLIDNQYGLKAEYAFSPFVAYTDLYLNAGGNAGINDEAMLTKYVDMVILEPERYSSLKEKYIKAYPKGDFKTFFSKALKTKLPAAPKFSLNERSGLVVSDKDHQNKFVFVDFWGTWCGSCVAEIDKIDAIHLKNPNPEKLVVTTIACYDKKKNVDDFMEKTKYSYQVLMSDGKVEKDFQIKGYPTKLLLLPNGVFLTIPFYSDYADILNKYLKWDI